MVATGLVLVALGVVGCQAPVAPPSGGGGSGPVRVTGERPASHGNGVLPSPIRFDPTIPQFQPLYGTASYAEFRSVLWSYFDGLCADHCGVRVVADYECADRDSGSCTVDHVDFTNPVHVGDTITVVLTDATTPSDSADSPVAPDSAVSSVPSGQ